MIYFFHQTCLDRKFSQPHSVSLFVCIILFSFSHCDSKSANLCLYLLPRHTFNSINKSNILVQWGPSRRKNTLHRIFHFIIHLSNIDLICKNLHMISFYILYSYNSILLIRFIWMQIPLQVFPMNIIKLSEYIRNWKSSKLNFVLSLHDTLCNWISNHIVISCPEDHPKLLIWMTNQSWCSKNQTNKSKNNWFSHERTNDKS